ncbi:unnamed protein product [Menidia menidia]|uniref:(Atlantic silverside) hypothetical protein n=1 Tax=Menidia menidia TaxID=238744 RepID=A0A8S4B524_9TELE|nr:unnamed protein product [Menidia menidia]
MFKRLVIRNLRRPVRGTQSDGAATSLRHAAPLCAFTRGKTKEGVSAVCHRTRLRSLCLCRCFLQNGTKKSWDFMRTHDRLLGRGGSMQSGPARQAGRKKAPPPVDARQKISQTCLFMSDDMQQSEEIFPQRIQSRRGPQPPSSQQK